jgi:tRNA threonylcarbamoyladenosine biosynthesis protein TsaE
MGPETEISDGARDVFAPPSGWTRTAVFRAGSPDATAMLARRMSDKTRVGDTFLLSGGLGAGKSHFARAFIRQALGVGADGIDIPSPSFTLVQAYDTDMGEIWHVDLYRLTGPQDALELGLEDAFGTARCLIEWPERLSPDWPHGAVWLRFEDDPQNLEDGRIISLWSAPDGPGDTAARVVSDWPEDVGT